MQNEIDISALIKPLDDNSVAVEWISNIAGLSLPVVRERLYAEERSLGANVSAEMIRREIRPFVWSDALAEFYATTDAFLFESMAWNRNPLKLVMRRWIRAALARHAKPALRILAFGDGLGFDSAYLASCGHAVTYFEVGEFSIQCARRVFQANAVAVKEVSNIADLQPHSFDAIVSLDVLEHVPEPVAVVASWSTFLKPGGLLVVSAPFFLITNRFTTHLAANQKYGGDMKLYEDQGFTLIDGRFFWNPLVLRYDGDRTSSQKPSTRMVHLGGMVQRIARRCPSPLRWAADWTRPHDARSLIGLMPDGATRHSPA